jgi:hypothetical protein
LVSIVLTAGDAFDAEAQKITPLECVARVIHSANMTNQHGTLVCFKVDWPAEINNDCKRMEQTNTQIKNRTVN